MSCAWTLDELISAYERCGVIEVPFTPHERALAQSVAAAWHFALWLEEMPGRCPDGSKAHGSLMWGINRVHQRRQEQAAGTTSSRRRCHFSNQQSS